MAIVIAAAAAAFGQGFVDGELVVDGGMTVGTPESEGGFDSVLVEDAAAASADDGGFATGSQPGSFSPAAPDGQAIGDGAGWPGGDCPSGACEVDGCPQPACPSWRLCGLGLLDGCRGDYCGPRWSAQVDSLILWQGQIQGMPFLTGPTGLVALDANEAQTSATPGFRAGLVRCLSECTALEGNYLWAQPFQSDTRVPPTAGLYTMTNLAGLTFTDVVAARMLTEAQLQGAEFNWRYCNGGIFTWLTGFRWVQWDQLSAINYAYAPSGGLPGGPGTVQSSVGNDLYGWQLGGLMRLWERGGRWQVKGVGKAGVFYNDAWQQTSVNDGRIPVPPNNPVYASGSRTAFVGELGVNSTLWINQWLAWRLGYTWFWLSGVAVPQEQLPISNIGDQTAGINTTGSVMLHGITTGLEFCW